MLTVLCIATFFGLVWLVAAVIHQIRKKVGGAETAKSASEFEVFMNNFIVRFLIEIFFELMICALISITSLAGGSIFWWIISLFVIVAGAIAIFAIASLFIKRGPYVKDSYAPSSFINSFWGLRPLDEEILKASILSEDRQTVTDSKVKGEDNVAIAGMGPTEYVQSIYNSEVPLN